ncbi:MAG: ADP-glyceromanno-heptose 6-epimerase [Verrucomicrobia bacterium]|nr:ADP-glyceromanno-heptose 6-epimerase [Verrucomicrobiota bacterium]
MSARYIVTGGAGFIGCNIARALNDRGCDDVLVVDHLGDSEKWKNLEAIRYEDYIDKVDFREMIRSGSVPKVEAVIHMGACSSTTETDADYLADNNYRYTRDLCEWCIERGIRFVYASSAATYGDGALGYSDNDKATPTLRPLNMYGYSKHMFDLWALKKGALKDIVGLKYFNVYGPFESHKGDMRSVVHKSYGQISETGKVRLFKSYKDEYADGAQVRDFIYVKDAVDVTLFFADHPEVSGLYNCGTGEARTWIDLVRSVFNAMNIEPAIEFIEMPEHLKSKYQYFTEAEMRKLRAAGYHKEFTSLEAGVSDYVRNHLAAGR